MDTLVNKEHGENSADRLIYLLKLEGRAQWEPAAVVGAHSPHPEQAPSTHWTSPAGARLLSYGVPDLTKAGMQTLETAGL